MKVALTGTSGSGKTTLCKFIAQELGLKHISGSAGDVKTEATNRYLNEKYGPNRIEGHLGVIQRSAEDWNYGWENQLSLQMDRDKLIIENDNFVTDRSPIDNMTFMVNQVGFHPEINDRAINQFYSKCVQSLLNLTHLIYVKAVQPQNTGIENNGSRIHNWFYQQSVDAMFDKWANQMIHDLNNYKPYNTLKTLVIDYWDLEQRKANIIEFLKS